MRRSPHGAALSTTLVATLATVVSAALLVLAPAPSAHAAARAATVVSGLSDAPRAVNPGQAYVVRVRVDGAPRRVVLQRRVGAEWRAVDVDRSARNGLAVLRWRPPARSGRIVLRMVVPKAGGRLAAVSRSWPVAVRPTRQRSGSLDDLLDPLLRQVLHLVNDVRTSPLTCGGERMPAVGTVRIDQRLNRAADDFARQMATRNFFDHDSPDGSGPGDRIDAAGYNWRTYGENIAAGFTDAASVVQGWIDSPGHCKNMMNPSFTHLGLGFAYDVTSTYGSYWVQDFASPM